MTEWYIGVISGNLDNRCTFTNIRNLTIVDSIVQLNVVAERSLSYRDSYFDLVTGGIDFDTSVTMPNQTYGIQFQENEIVRSDLVLNFLAGNSSFQWTKYVFFFFLFFDQKNQIKR